MRVALLIGLLVLGSACGKEKSEVEILLERSMVPMPSTESRTAMKQIEDLGEYAVAELMRIASDASYPEGMRVNAISCMRARPSALPTIIACLDDLSDTIRREATYSLNGCLPFGVYESESDSMIMDDYRAWWSRHRKDYAEELARLYHSGYKDFPRPRGSDRETDARKLFLELTRGMKMTSNAPQFRRLVALGKMAIPELGAIATDTSIVARAMAYSILGRMKETEAVAVLLDALEGERDPGALMLITNALDARLHLGRIDPLKPESRSVVDMYRAWWRGNRTKSIPTSGKS